MLEYKYNATILLLISYCVQAASIDLFNGPLIYDQLFLFRETGPFNPIFELFDIGDMNFMMNSASLPIIFILIVAAGILYKLLKKVAKKYYRFKIFRKIGMYSDE